jgi:hypothetical protein
MRRHEDSDAGGYPANQYRVHFNQPKQGANHRLHPGRSAALRVDDPGARNEFTDGLAKDRLEDRKVRSHEPKPNKHSFLVELVSKQVIREEQETHQYNEINPRTQPSIYDDR